MYCAKCGSKLLDGAVFCSKCGTPVDEAQVQTNAVEQTKTPIKHQSKSRRSRKLAMPILLALIALVVLVGCIFLIKPFFKRSPDLMVNAWYGNSSENIACGAAFVEMDGIIYFDSPISDAIYAVDQRGTTAYQVIPDSVNKSDNRYLNISRDGFLYYVTGFRSNKIVKLDLSDPSNEVETIYEAKSGSIYDLTIVDDNIYFRVGDLYESKIYMADKDCKSVSKIAKGGPMTVRNGWLYYYAGGKKTCSIYRIRSNGAEKEKLYEREGLISSVFIADNCLYFTGYAPGSAGYVDIESKSYQEISPNNSDIILEMNYINGDPILIHSEYTESLNRGVLFQENEKTKDIVKVINLVGKFGGYSVIGKYIYYMAIGQQGFSDEFEGWRDICAYRVNIDSGEGEYILLDSEGDSSLLRYNGNNPSPTEDYGSEARTEISNDDGNDLEPVAMQEDNLDAKERYEELLVKFARDGSEMVGSIDDLKNARQYPIKDEVVNGSFCDGVIQIDDFVLYMDGRMTILDAIEKIAASEESANYRIEEYGIEDIGYVVPGTYTVCQRVTINVYRGKEGGFTMYGLNDKPSDINRSPANFRLVDVIWTHLAKYAMGIDGSSWEYQYDYDKEIFDRLPSMYPVETDWVLDRYQQPGDCYIFQRDTNNFTDSYRMHCVANNPINVDGTDMYANFVYDFEEGYSTYNGGTLNYSGAPARISVRLGMGITFSKVD